MKLYGAAVSNGLTNCSQEKLMKLEFEICFHLNRQAGTGANGKWICLRSSMFDVFNQFTLYHIIPSPSIH